MKQKEFKNAEEALEKFGECASIRATALNQGVSRVANKMIDEERRCVLYLYEHHQIERLLPCLKNENPGIRMDAASILLPYFEQELMNKVRSKECVDTLFEIAKEKDNCYGFVGIIAEITLDQWKKGMLSLLWKDNVVKTTV